MRCRQAGQAASPETAANNPQGVVTMTWPDLLAAPGKFYHLMEGTFENILPVTPNWRYSYLLEQVLSRSGSAPTVR